eukprot:CAMPEP_0184050636 /NCGR_PEP_ID=MMETSP0956-20121227/4187_1 /TAXON_ID=627963 /ORGANISM="Aplanochytrium sp, Strain PBS07" /LENGTH=79 /DNA_ID=CAMNT_0026343283 /DNA_START=324 /DNA_END=563 /DNA_ORIENTATION=-
MIKVILVVDAETDQEMMPEDTKVKQFLEKLYLAYVDTLSNPFFQVGPTSVLGSCGDSKDLFLDRLSKRVISLQQSTALK